MTTVDEIVDEIVNKIRDYKEYIVADEEFRDYLGDILNQTSTNLETLFDINLLIQENTSLVHLLVALGGSVSAFSEEFVKFHDYFIEMVTEYGSGTLVAIDEHRKELEDARIAESGEEAQSTS